MAATCSTFQTTLGLRTAAPVRAARTTRAARPSVVVRAETDTTTKAPAADVTVGSAGDKKALGYFAEDSAGQTNIFAVETKAYVAGSALDDTDSTPTLLFAGIGGAVAIAAVAVGVLGGQAQVQNAIPVYEEEGKYETISSYAAKFGAAPAAPSL